MVKRGKGISALASAGCCPHKFPISPVILFTYLSLLPPVSSPPSIFFAALRVLHCPSPPSTLNGTRTQKPTSAPNSMHAHRLTCLERDSDYKHDKGKTHKDCKCEGGTYRPLIQEN